MWLLSEIILNALAQPPPQEFPAPRIPLARARCRDQGGVNRHRGGKADVWADMGKVGKERRGTASPRLAPNNNAGADHDRTYRNM